MRKAQNIERVICDVYDLVMSVLNGNERIERIKFDKDGDLIITTTDGKKDYHWEIGFGDDGEEDI